MPVPATLREMSSRRSAGPNPAPTRDPLTRELLLRNVRRALFGSDGLATVGPFEVRRRLGGGAMGSIFEAFDPRLRRSVALKLVDVQALPQEQVRLVAREARALAQLDDPNVVTVYDAGESDLGIWVAMELLSGEDLEAWSAASSRRSVAELIDVLRGVAKGLVSVHAAGVVHRDVKPANVFVVADGRVKLIDFGLALSGVDSRSHDSSAARRRTQSRDLRRSVSGTPAYMAPEQHRSGRATALSDQYAWCVMAWELLYGVRPFVSSELEALYRRKLEANLPSRPLRADVPRSVHASLLRGLSARPDERWPSMAELVRQWTRSKSRLRRPILAVSAIAAVGVLTWVASAGPQPSPCSGTRAWTDAERGAVQAAVLDVESDLRRDTWARIDPRLTAGARAYHAAHAETCELLRSGDLEERVADLRFACLQDWQAAFGRVTQTLQDASDEAIVGAIGWTLQLDDPAQCAELESRPASKTPAPRPSLRAVVAAARRDLDIARANHDLARYEQALEGLDALSRSRAAREFAPLGAEILHQRGRTLHEIGRFDEAESAYVDAFHRAQRVRHDYIAVRSAVGMVLLAVSQADRSKAETWLRQGRAAGPEPWPELPVTLVACEAFVWSLREDHERAVEVSLLSMELAKELPPSALKMATVTDTVGRLNRIGRSEEAFALAQRDVAEREAILGPSHPWLAPAVANLAMSAWDVGLVDQSLAAFERELKLEREHRGEDAFPVAITLMNYGGKLVSVERWEEASVKLEKAEAILAELLEPSHPYLAIIALRRGSALRGLGLLDEALGHFERGRVIAEQAKGADSTLVGWALIDKGGVRLARATDDVTDALELLEAGWKIVESAVGEDNTGSSGRALLWLADATWRNGSQVAAVEMAERARRISDLPHPAAQLIVEDVEAWLREHPMPPAD